jgi:hypothetical protein
MPIKIYHLESASQSLQNDDEIAWLCDEIWELPDQLDALEKWIEEFHGKIGIERKVADIGFEVRSNATGGGSVLSARTMRLASKMNLDIYFSEYGHNVSETN